MRPLITLLLFAGAAAGFVSWFWRARQLTGDPTKHVELKRSLRSIMLVSFILLGAALLVSVMVRPNVR
jgi:DMSO reductase anchor subunit